MSQGHGSLAFASGEIICQGRFPVYTRSRIAFWPWSRSLHCNPREFPDFLNQGYQVAFYGVCWLCVCPGTRSAGTRGGRTACNSLRSFDTVEHEHVSQELVLSTDACAM
jgi:hypothetical protein